MVSPSTTVPARAARPARVLLVDDHQVVRDALRKLLVGRGGVEVVGEAADGRSGVRLAAMLAPDVVVMDVAMPDLNGIEATRQVVAANPRTKVIALSALSRDERVMAACLRAGAAGYLPKEASFDELTAAVDEVMRNRIYLSPRVAPVLLAALREPGPEATSPFVRLSPREREVLQLVAEGKATKEVAAILNVSVKTIETHRRALMDKLHVDSVAELTKYAIREGITQLDAPVGGA